MGGGKEKRRGVEFEICWLLGEGYLATVFRSRGTGNLKPEREYKERRGSRITGWVGLGCLYEVVDPLSWTLVGFISKTREKVGTQDVILLVWFC